MIINQSGEVFQLVTEIVNIWKILLLPGKWWRVTRELSSPVRL